MPDTLKDKRDYLERAAKAYAEFKTRTETNPMLTREEKIERIESLLDSHVSVFDDYFTEWDAYRQQRRAARKKVESGDGLSADARDMAYDIAAVFTRSGTRAFYNVNTDGRSAVSQGRYLDLIGNRLLSNEKQKEQGDSDVSFAETAQQNFQKSQQATSMRPGAGLREEQAQRREQDAQRQLDSIQDARQAARDLREETEAAVRRAEGLEALIDQDPMGRDESGDEAVRSSWDEVRAKAEEYRLAQEKLAEALATEGEAQNKLADAQANLAGARAARVRAQAATTIQSRAGQRKEWSKAEQAKIDSAEGQLAEAQRELADAQDRLYEAEMAKTEAEKRVRKAQAAAEKAKQHAQGVETLIDQDPMGRDESGQAAIDAAWDEEKEARRKAEQTEEAPANQIAFRAHAVSKAQRDRAFQASQQAKAARDHIRDQARAAQKPVVLFERQRRERTQGLSAGQIKGIRDISAFLYRNTLHGSDKDDRKFIGAFVDGINARPPRVKLLAFYLIENDELHAKPDMARLAYIQATYTPQLDKFKPHIFNGWFGGFFHRESGEGLDWDKLSDAIHNAEDILTEAVSQQPLPANAAALAGAPGAGGQPVDPQMAALLRNMAAAGAELLNNPNPSPDAVKALMDTVNELEAYISSQEESGWADAKDFFKEAQQWIGYYKKPLSIIGSFFGGASKTVQETHLKELLKDNPKYEGDGSNFNSTMLKALGVPFSWCAVPFSLVNTLFSFITVAGALEQTFAHGIGAYARGKAILGLVKEASSTGFSVYGEVRSIAGIVDTTRTLFMGRSTGVAWITDPVATGAAGIGAMAVGLMTAIQGVMDVAEGDRARQAIEKYQSEMRRNPPDTSNLSQAQIEELKAQRDMLLNVATALRQNEIRKETGGVFKTASGVLQIVSGGLMMGSGGTLALVSAGVSLVAFCVSIGGAVTDFIMKRKAKKDVIDKYIGMDGPDGLYAQFKKSKDEAANPKSFIKKYGKEDQVKNMLRRTAEAQLGFPSDDKMHAYIMQRYAQALYKGAFLDENGNVLTADRESQPGEREKRKIFTSLLKAAGFEVKYPDPDADPPVEQSPDANAIYKKLMS